LATTTFDCYEVVTPLFAIDGKMADWYLIPICFAIPERVEAFFAILDGR
jgi:hypothetical protein